MSVRIRAVLTKSSLPDRVCGCCGHHTLQYKQHTRYVIDETVTADGLFITWPGLFTTRAAAQREIDLTLT